MKFLGKILALVMGTGFLTPMTDVFAGDWQWRNQIPKYIQANVNKQLKGSTLLFSDSPEMVQDCGVMYRDIVKGKVRFFFHHVNDTSSSKQLAIVFQSENRLRPAMVTVGREGISKPNVDWLRAGKEAQRKFFEKENFRSFKLTGKREFLTGKTGMKFRPQELITGIVDLDFSSPVKVSFMMLPMKTDFDAAVDVYDILPPDKGGHVLRGTFPGNELKIATSENFNTDQDTIWGVTLANANDYVKGIDVTTGKKVVNFGNYGVVYTLSFKTAGDRATEVRFNPYGGIFAGICEFYDGQKTTLIPLPKDKTAFDGEKSYDTVALGKILPGKEGRFIFSPPGSSNLPIRIFLAPEVKVKKVSFKDRLLAVRSKNADAQRKNNKICKAMKEKNEKT